MKKKMIISILVFLVLIIVICLGISIKKKLDIKKEEERIKNARIEVILVGDLEVPFLEKKKVSDFITSINGDIIEDYQIDTTSIGKKIISFEFINDEGIKVPYSYEIEVKDVTPPTVLLGGSYRVKRVLLLSL